MIENILGSKAQLRIIRLLLMYPNKYFSAREIEHLCNVRGGNLHRSLNKLVLFGIVDDGYRIRMTPFTEMLMELFEKERRYFQNIDLPELRILSEVSGKLLNKFSDIKDIILFGSIARGMYSEKSDIDMLILKNKVNNMVELEITSLVSGYDRQIQFFLHTDYNDEPFMEEARKEGVSLLGLFKPLVSRLSGLTLPSRAEG